MIGIVVVAYNSANVIGACLDSCRPYEVIVVDNASTDATLAEIHRRSWVQVIANATNLGFAAAVNQGVQALQSDFLLILNPDVVLTGTLQPLVEACSRPGVGAACGLLLDENGQAQTGFSVRRFPQASTLALEVLGCNRLFPDNPVNRRYRCLDLDLSQPQEVEQPAGAFLLFRRDVWNILGGFDPQFYPLWFEDVDFCHRLIASGQTILFLPQVTARHLGGHSIGQLTWSCREVYWYGSLLRYAAKYFNAGPFRGVCLAVALGSFLRTGVEVIRTRTFQPWLAYGKIVHLAVVYGVRGPMARASVKRVQRRAVD